MTHELMYLATLTPDPTDGGFVVTFQDVPEAITQGNDLADALAQASDALEEAIAGRIRRGDSIPEPFASSTKQPERYRLKCCVLLTIPSGSST